MNYYIVEEKVKFIEWHYSQKLGVLYRCSQYLTCLARKTVYNTIILPHFLFASTILYLVNKEGIACLQLLQNRAMRSILKCNKYTRIKDMLKTLGWIGVEGFLEMQTLIFIHRMRLGNVPEYLGDVLISFQQVHDHNTRNKTGFMLQQTMSSAAHNSIFVRGVVQYNRLPITMTQKTLMQFKHKIKEHYSQMV